MRKRTLCLQALILLLTFTVLDPVHAEERKVLSRSYVGLAVEVFAPYQSYPGDTITIRVRVEALEDVKNASVTTFLWSSKSEGQSPWGVSFTVLDVTDFLKGTFKDERCNTTIPSDIDSGLFYGILWLQWNIYRSPSWEEQLDKASFRATYVKNRNYENLQTSYWSAINDLRNARTLMYIFLTTTIILAVFMLYFARKEARRLKVHG